MLSVYMCGIYNLCIYVAVTSPYPRNRDVTPRLLQKKEGRMQTRNKLIIEVQKVLRSNALGNQIGNEQDRGQCEGKRENNGGINSFSLPSVLKTQREGKTPPLKLKRHASFRSLTHVPRPSWSEITLKMKSHSSGPLG